MAPLRLACALACTVGVAALDVRQAPELQPSLTPKSDKKFFGKDYPHDLRPSIDAAPKWSYPYPKIQENKRYDEDFVEDENSDGGHWAAQMDYDSLKMKFAKQQKVLQDALAKEEQERDEAEAAAAARDQEAAQLEAADAARAKHKSKKTLEAEQGVRDAREHLKGCEQALEDAKSALRASQAADYKKEHGRAPTAAEAELSEAPASAVAIAAEREVAEHVLAQKVVAEEENKLQRLKKDLDAAEAKLREFRGEPNATEARLHAERSGAPQRAVSGLSFAALLLLAYA